MKSCLLETPEGVMDQNVVRMSKDLCHPFTELVVAMMVAEEDIPYIGSTLIAERLFADHADSDRRPGSMVKTQESLPEHRSTILTIVVAVFHSVRALFALLRCVRLLCHCARSTRSLVVEGDEMTRK